MRRCDISVPKLHLAPMMAPCPTRGHTTNTEDTTCLEHTKRKKKKTCTKKQNVFRNNHHAIMTRHKKKGVQKKSNAVTLTTYPCRTLNMCSAHESTPVFSVPQMNTEGSCSQMEAPHRTSTRIIRKSTSKKKKWTANRRRVEDSTLSSSRARQNSNSYAVHNWNKNIRVKKELVKAFIMSSSALHFATQFAHRQGAS